MNIDLIKKALTENNVQFEDVDYSVMSGMTHFCKVILENDQDFESLAYNLSCAMDDLEDTELGTIYTDGGELIVELIES